MKKELPAPANLYTLDKTCKKVYISTFCGPLFINNISNKCQVLIANSGVCAIFYKYCYYLFIVKSCHVIIFAVGGHSTPTVHADKLRIHCIKC